MQDCLCEIVFQAALWEFEVWVVHLPGQDNRLPDLSQWHLKGSFPEEFFRLAGGGQLTDFVGPDDLFTFSHTW